MTPMHHALAIAKEGASRGEVPVGAVMVYRGEIIASAHNLTETLYDVTAHAEMLCIRESAKILGTPRLTECELYVTLEPCAMCATAIAFARIRKLVFGAYDPKGGGVEYGARIFSQATCHHTPETIGGVDEGVCGHLLKDFFEARR